MAAATLQYSPATQQKMLIPSRRSQRTPRQYLGLRQHRRTFSQEEVLLRYAQNLDISYQVKIPKPLYREATEARRAAHMRTRLRPLSYAATPKAPRVKGPAPSPSTGKGGGFSKKDDDAFVWVSHVPGRPTNFCVPRKRLGYTPSDGPEPL